MANERQKPTNKKYLKNHSKIKWNSDKKKQEDKDANSRD